MKFLVCLRFPVPVALDHRMRPNIESLEAERYWGRVLYNCATIKTNARVEIKALIILSAQNPIQGCA